MSGIIWIIVIGFVAGIIARFLSPGPNNPTGFILTTVLGIAGAFLATFIGQTVGWYKLDQGAGFIAATGLAVLFLVAYGVRRGELWAWVGAVAAPVLGLAVALPAHYPNHFDTLGHLGLIYLATLIFVVGALLALRGIIAQHRG